jgi:hypothetical protein
VQVIAPNLTVPLRFDDLRSSEEADTETVGHRIVHEEALHTFDLIRGPLFRTRLVRQTEHGHLLLISMHQLIADGWSLGVLADELTALYDAFSGREASLEPLSIQYADFASWQRHHRSHPDIVAQLAYWREQLHDPLPVMKFPTRPKRKIEDFRTARREVTLPASLLDAARRFSHQEGGTLYMVLVAAFKVLLHRYLGQDDMRVATLLANRNRPGTEALIGPLVNTVILRTSLEGDPSSQEVMRRVRATTLAAFAHQDLPFEDLVEMLERERGLDPAALAHTMIWLQNAALRPLASSGQELSFEEANPNALLPLVTITTFDVTLMLRESSDGLGGCCVYKPHLFGKRIIDRLLRDFQEVLEHMVSQPERPISEISVSLKKRERRVRR